MKPAVHAQRGAPGITRRMRFDNYARTEYVVVSYLGAHDGSVWSWEYVLGAAPGTQAEAMRPKLVAPAALADLWRPPG